MTGGPWLLLFPEITKLSSTQTVGKFNLSSWFPSSCIKRRYVELLKRRFGENHLHYCDIMLKDIQDSHRINRHIKTEISKKGMEPKKPLDDGEKIDAVSTEEEGVRDFLNFLSVH